MRIEWAWRSPAEICWRKVRAGQGTVTANSRPGQPAGKCRRKYTADGALFQIGTCSQAMVQWCGKSAPRWW